MYLREISNGQISGTGTIECPSGILGGANILANGEDEGTVVIRADDEAGPVLLEVTTALPTFPVAPIHAGTRTLHYSITGTGCTAQLYAWMTAQLQGERSPMASGR